MSPPEERAIKAVCSAGLRPGQHGRERCWTNQLGTNRNAKGQKLTDYFLACTRGYNRQGHRYDLLWPTRHGRADDRWTPCLQIQINCSISSEIACRKRHVVMNTLQPPNRTNRCKLLFAPQQSVGDWSWTFVLIFLVPDICAIMQSRSNPIQRRDMGLEASCWFSSLCYFGRIYTSRMSIPIGYYSPQFFSSSLNCPPSTSAV